MKKVLSFILALFFVFSVTVYATEDTAKYIYESVKAPSVGSVGGEWAVLGIARSDYEVPAEYYEKYIESIRNYLRDNDGVLHSVKYTEYSRVVIALTAIGVNPADFDGLNLVEPLFDEDKIYTQGINGPIWALIALDCCNPETESEIKTKYINEILSKELNGGGWSLGDFDDPDADITAMALTALSRHRDRGDVVAAIERGISYLSSVQLESGGFMGRYGESSETCAQVIIALCSLGIEIDDARFIKNGNTTLDNLKSFSGGNGGFLHEVGGDVVNRMATEQALCALSSVKRFNENRPTLFDMSDAKILVTLSNLPEAGLNGKHSDVNLKPVVNEGKTFADIVNHGAKAKIEALAARGIINGMDDNNFAPDNHMTRAEYTAIIVRGLGLPQKQIDKFSDVTSADWFYDYVGTAYEYGVVNGVSDTEFNPNGTITREEAAVMTARAAKLCGLTKEYHGSGVRDVLAGFIDYIKVSDWATESLALCYDFGILSDEEIEILPKNEIKRAEIAEMLYNMLEKANLL